MVRNAGIEVKHMERLFSFPELFRGLAYAVQVVEIDLDEMEQVVGLFLSALFAEFFEALKGLLFVTGEYVDLAVQIVQHPDKRLANAAIAARDDEDLSESDVTSCSVNSALGGEYWP